MSFAKNMFLADDIKSLLYQQTLTQAVSAESLDWVLRAPCRLGEALADALEINSAALRSCETWPEIVASTGAIEAIASSKRALNKIVSAIPASQLATTFIATTHWHPDIRTAIENDPIAVDALNSKAQIKYTAEIKVGIVRSEWCWVHSVKGGKRDNGTWIDTTWSGFPDGSSFVCSGGATVIVNKFAYNLSFDTKQIPNATESNRAYAKITI